MAGVLGDRRVLVLLVLVLLGSGLSVALALTRPDVDSAPAPPGVTGATPPGFRPADLLGPGGDALAAAVPALSAALSYDHADLDGSRQRATSTMTTTYARTYARTFDSRVRPLATSRRSTVEGLVRGAGVVRAIDDETVVCLLYVDQVQTGGRGVRAGATRVLSRNRARVLLRRVDGTWRIDSISPL